MFPSAGEKGKGIVASKDWTSQDRNHSIQLPAKHAKKRESFVLFLVTVMVVWALTMGLLADGGKAVLGLGFPQAAA